MKTRSPIHVGRDQKMRKLFSTGQIAEMIGTCAKVVAGWIDSGELKGVKLPGSTNERRVHRDELRRFCERWGYAWALAELDAEEGMKALTPARRRAAIGQSPRTNGRARAGQN